MKQQRASLSSGSQIFELKQEETSPKKKYSWAEIMKHKSLDDLWMVVKGKVYDVTTWVPNHPGGNIILQAAGREATALFVSYHPLRVQQLIQKYEIGEVEDYQPFYKWDSSDFYPVLKRRVEAYVKEHDLNRSSYVMYFKALLIVTCWFICYYYGMIQGYFLAAVGLGFWHSHFGITISHDGNHGSFSKTPFLNQLAVRAIDIMGGSSIVWVHQHNIGHHPNSNRQGDSCHSEGDQDDPDTRTGTPIIRMVPTMPYLWYHRWQHIYIWFLFCAVTTKWFYGDIKAFSRKKYVNIEFYDTKPSDLVFLAFTKLLYITYVFIIPMYFHPISRALILVFLFSAMTSYNFVAMFSVNHLTENAFYPSDNIVNRDWAQLQVLTTSNFAVGSALWTWLSGGLNYQIEHHLFPYICHVYLPEISPIIQQTLQEYNLPYTNFPTFVDAFTSHYQHLKGLSNPEDNCAKTQ